MSADPNTQEALARLKDGLSTADPQKYLPPDLLQSIVSLYQTFPQEVVSIITPLPRAIKGKGQKKPSGNILSKVATHSKVQSAIHKNRLGLNVSTTTIFTDWKEWTHERKPTSTSASKIGEPS